MYWAGTWDCFRRIEINGSSKLASDLILKKKEIRAFLDQYVIGQDQKSNVSCGLQSLQAFDAAANGRWSRDWKVTSLWWDKPEQEDISS
jgi:hypothetical protein